MPWAGNLFRAGAGGDFPEQLVGRSDKRKPQNEYFYINYNTCAWAGCVRRPHSGAPAAKRHWSITSKMSFPVVVPRNGTSWRNSSHTFRSAVTPLMKTASWAVCSANFCHLNHLCHSSPVLSIHINSFCQPHHFCQLLSTQSSPVLSTTSTTYVATDEVNTFVNKARPLLSTVIFLPIYLRLLCSVTIWSNRLIFLI